MDRHLSNGRCIKKLRFKGRLYGGVGFLIKKSHCKHITFVICCKRYTIIIVMNAVLFINVYLPTVKNEFELNTLIDILFAIELIISNYSNLPIIFWGDLNMCLVGKSKYVNILIDFITDHQLNLCNILILVLLTLLIVMNRCKIIVTLIISLSRRASQII